uniref:Uncharacterized protein n=1 Tax=Nelumbo nucifera TaxID=4432 RepID=A0A822ZSS4_NELNU|nr:TPA_asm: hypothetical protein HUJ06_004207 [Nelumbo nucifera]
MSETSNSFVKLSFSPRAFQDRMLFLGHSLELLEVEIAQKKYRKLRYQRSATYEDKLKCNQCMSSYQDSKSCNFTKYVA